MLKINKTLSKVKIYHIGIIALICGIMPGLMGLSYYGSVEKASAATLSIDDISTMQEMRPGICYNMKIGDTATLTDTRDDSTYTIAKLSDGKCWMTQNLRLANYTTATDDSQTAGVAIPNKATNFTGKDNEAAYYSGNEVYGAYYSWYTATAHTGTTELTNGEASGSICPKGWRLPKGGSGGEFQTLYSQGKSSWASDENGNGFWLGGATNTTNAAFFPAAGIYNGTSAAGVNSYGYYWSSTANDSSFAYDLYFYSSGSIDPADTRDKCLGFPIRCIASGPEDEDPNLSDQKDVDVIAIVVPPVISIDATSGMKEEVDPNKITTGTISATVSANATYAVQLSANKTSLTNSALVVDTEITSSNSIPASTNVQAKTNAWGILNQDNSTYSAITSTPTTYHNTENTNEDSSKTHAFTLGVSVSPTLPAGEYSTTVAITAVNN